MGVDFFFGKIGLGAPRKLFEKKCDFGVNFSFLAVIWKVLNVEKLVLEFLSNNDHCKKDTYNPNSCRANCTIM